ncbi:MAG TPA: hypothetical protein VMT16_14975 [Thermoanaerobaculia bacterium]|nr:hypothetical protein [Thermoanaerobaculia bacterium]
MNLPGYFAGTDPAALGFTPQIPFTVMIRTLSGMITEPANAFSPIGWMTTTWSAIFLLAALLLAVRGARLLPIPYSLYLALQW